MLFYFVKNNLIWYYIIMLDIKFIRENPELIKEAARKKRVNFDVEELLKIDEERRKALQETEELRATQNTESEHIAKIKEEKEKNEAIAKMKEVKEKLSRKEDELKKIIEKWDVLMLQVPNVPDPSVPEGESDADNKEIRKWGKIPAFDFEPKNHEELMKNLDLVDLERGAKVAGFRGYFLKGDAALLSVALWQLAFEMWAKKGFVPLIAPSLVSRRKFYQAAVGFLRGRKKFIKRRTIYISPEQRKCR